MGIIKDFIKIMTTENTWTPSANKFYSNKIINHVPLGWDNPNFPYTETISVYCDFPNGKRIRCSFICDYDYIKINVKHKTFKYKLDTVSFEEDYLDNLDIFQTIIVKINYKSQPYKIKEGINYIEKGKKYYKPKEGINYI